jgi:protein-tyrosine-phosphatase
MAEGILKNKIPSIIKNKIKVFSAGTNTVNGMRVSAFAEEVAKKYNVNISSHKSKQLNEEMITKSDFIFTMSQDHIDFFRKRFLKYMDKVYPLKKFENAEPQNANSDIIDPVGGNIDSYEKIFLEINGEIERILPKLLEIAKQI